MNDSDYGCKLDICVFLGKVNKLYGRIELDVFDVRNDRHLFQTSRKKVEIFQHE